MPGGRPTTYNDEIAQEICDKVATSTKGLVKLCKENDHWPNRDTINLWRFKHDEFSVRYNKAKAAQMDLMAEECIDIADESEGDTIINKDGKEVCNNEYVNRSRLRVDTRKWLASKLMPKIYGTQPQTDDTQNSLIEKLIDKMK